MQDNIEIRRVSAEDFSALRKIYERVRKESFFWMDSREIRPEDFERCRRVLYADEIRAYDSAEEIAGTLLTFALEETDPFVYPELLADIRCEELTPLLDDMLCEGSWCLSQVCPRAASNQKGVM